MKRVLLLVACLVIASIIIAPRAVAKDGVEATLASDIPLAAEPGESLEVVWTLTYTAEDGARRPFGANGVFVRLRGRSGGVEEGVAPLGEYSDGTYTARVMVPAAGIADVEIGLQGWNDEGRADAMFPIANDPLPGSARIAPVASSQRASDRPNRGVETWIIGALVSAAALGVALVLLAAHRSRGLWTRRRAMARDAAES